VKKSLVCLVMVMLTAPLAVYKMQTAIVKWGNSQGIRLPKAFLKNINLSEDDTVEVTSENDTIVIKKRGEKRHLRSLEKAGCFLTFTICVF
jgi:antitoxin component of MazEF toxin-antitoxin module